MIVYEEFSSLVKDLGISGKTLYSASNQLHKHYHPVNIPKGNGEYRRLYVPDDFLKMIQRRIHDRFWRQKKSLLTQPHTDLAAVQESMPAPM